MKFAREWLVALSGLLLAAQSSDASEVIVIKSYAACKDPLTVEKFEEFERNDDDQGYKRLFFSTGATRECIFLRTNEILTSGETRDRWICVKSTESSPCYWTASVAVRAR
jgi:hypothetical protein